jgi:hypothetical protein
MTPFRSEPYLGVRMSASTATGEEEERSPGRRAASCADISGRSGGATLESLVHLPHLVASFCVQMAPKRSTDGI